VTNGLELVTGGFRSEGRHLLFANSEWDKTEVENPALERCVFANVGMRRTRFKAGRIQHSRFERCYLREAGFVGVDLTGTAFVDCNLRHASFERSTLDYVTFQNCELDDLDILDNLPTRPNMRRHLLHTLRNNAAQTGNRFDEVRLLAAELDAERAELYATFTGATDYFRTKPTHVRVKAFGRWLGHLVQVRVWGYGLRFWILARTAALVVTGAALLIWAAGFNYQVSAACPPRSLTLAESCFLSATTFSTVGGANYIPMDWLGGLVIGIESIAGAGFVGLLAAVVYRKISR